MNDMSQPPKSDAVPVSDFYEITETLTPDELATLVSAASVSAHGGYGGVIAWPGM